MSKSRINPRKGHAIPQERGKKQQLFADSKNPVLQGVIARKGNAIFYWMKKKGKKVLQSIAISLISNSSQR